MNKYFGTDGIRGTYGDNLDAKLAHKVGLALTGFFGKGRYLVGRDTRLSGPETEDALISGMIAGGGNVVKVGVLPTPALSMLAKKYAFDCAVVVSASHNPPEYNGIKIFDSQGLKLNDEREGSIEYYIDNPPPPSKSKGSVAFSGSAADDYVDFLTSAPGVRLNGVKVCLDCGFGAAGVVAKRVYERLGASVTMINDALDGSRINSGCGALYPECVTEAARKANCDLGLAFDGDADRISVVAGGKSVDGDSVLYDLSRVTELSGGVVVGTVLTNSALEYKLASEGNRLLRTPVGDKYVSELMRSCGYTLGGEQSGHYITSPHVTGDGILSGLNYCKSLILNGGTPTRLELVPQKSVSVPSAPTAVYDEGLIALTKGCAERLARKGGRIVVRPSGTEPKLRVMAECGDESEVDITLKTVKEYISGLNKKE